MIDIKNITFELNASKKCPLNKFITHLVPPHAGHNIPSIFIYPAFR